MSDRQEGDELHTDQNKHQRGAGKATLGGRGVGLTMACTATTVAARTPHGPRARLRQERRRECDIRDQHRKHRHDLDCPRALAIARAMK